MQSSPSLLLPVACDDKFTRAGNCRTMRTTSPCSPPLKMQYEAFAPEHPEVEENRLKRASLTVQELPEADKALLQSALPVLEELSDEPLGEDFGEDFAEMLSPRLHNDAVGPVPDLPAGAKPLMGEYRAFSRISKMALLVEKGAKIFDSKEIKSARLAHLGYTVVQLLTQLVQIGCRLFEVLL